MDREYYQKFYKYEREHWYFLVRSRIIRDILARRKDLNSAPKILNVGVATGATSEMLGFFGDVVSVEFDKEVALFTETVLKKKVYNDSITDLPFKANSFDIVCAFDVIEHVDDDGRAIMEMYRVCKPEGIVYLTVPAFMSLWSDHDVINHHKRRYRLHQIRKLFHGIHGTEAYAGHFNSLLFMPIFFARMFINLIAKARKNHKRTADFDFISEKSIFGRLVNSVLGFFFSLEIHLLKFIRFPFGVSIIYLWKKKA